jgi:hypothetical protein
MVSPFGHSRFYPNILQLIQYPMAASILKASGKTKKVIKGKAILVTGCEGP